MITELINTYPNQMEALANAWLASGASELSIWKDDQLLAHWPEYALSADHYISVPLMMDGMVVGELRASGVSGEAALARLTVEAELLTSLAPLTRDLYGMTTELVNARDQLLAIYNLTQINRRCLDVNQGLANLAAELPRLVKTEGAFILLKGETGKIQIEQYPLAIFDGVALLDLSRQVEKAPYLLYNSPETCPDLPPDVRSLLVVPIQMRGGSVAILGWVNKILGKFMSPDIKLARAIAAYAGGQIENLLMIQENMQLARLQTEMELAQRVQSSLLPKEPPTIPGAEIAAASFPASLVGGDYFDFITRPECPVTLVVGDLSGKGFPAALLMSMTRTVLRTEANAITTPERILAGVNRELYEDFTRLNSFATLFVGQYDPPSRIFVYANAGHSPVIYRPAGQKAQLLIADGTAMGILPHSQSKDFRIDLQPGDLLIIGTDGLVEARDPNGNQFSYPRLLALTETLEAYSAQEMVHCIFDAIKAFCAGTPQEDDQTLVVMKCTGKIS